MTPEPSRPPIVARPGATFLILFLSRDAREPSHGARICFYVQSTYECRNVPPAATSGLFRHRDVARPGATLSPTCNLFQTHSCRGRLARPASRSRGASSTSVGRPGSPAACPVQGHQDVGGALQLGRRLGLRLGWPHEGGSGPRNGRPSRGERGQALLTTAKLYGRIS
jgi:hypothetical protein